MMKFDVFGWHALLNVFLIIPCLKPENLLNYEYMYVFDTSYKTKNANMLKVEWY